MSALFEVNESDVAITSDDCYTPRWVFDAMGLEFDLDVAAPVGGPWHVPCRWVLDLLGYCDGDTIDDLFPGSGVMGRVASQTSLDFGDAS